MEKRKIDERNFSNKKIKERWNFNKNIYAITKESENFIHNLILKSVRNKGKARILDYGCGQGFLSLKLTKKGFNVIGIDLSAECIKTCKKNTKENKVKNAKFYVMDCEKTKFQKDYFDMILCHSILHHLNIEKAFQELRRILKPSGKIVCLEPLAHNQFIQLYRKLTPNLRTKWEKAHILTLKNINTAKKYFDIKEMKYFHLFSILAIPLANTKIFKPLLAFFNRLDRKMLRLSLINKLAWQILFVLEKKDVK